MNKNPFFSVILPVYNVEHYLDRCIESILKQEFNDYEILLIDDGSKDNSPQMCDEWSKKDDRIRVVHKKNEGLGMARNTGVDNAQGSYLIFIDSDDYILPELFSDVYKAIVSKDVQVVFYGMKRVTGEGKVLMDLIPSPDKMFYDNKEEIMNKLMPDFIARDPYVGRATNLRISVCTSCIKKDILTQNNLKFVSERNYISEDLYFYIQLFSYLERVSFLQKSYYCYLQNMGSLTFSYKPERFIRIKKFYDDALKLSNDLKYDGTLQTRLMAYLISHTMGCLKMEAANIKADGLERAYSRIKEIGKDEYLQEALSKYPNKYFSRNWKIFSYCILNNKYRLLLLILWAQYHAKGV